MNRDQYNALRHAAYEAARAYVRQINDDGRSSYGSKSIMDLHALREAEAAAIRVPRNRSVERERLFNVRTEARRRGLINLLRERNFARARGWPYHREAYAIRTILDPAYPAREQAERTARALARGGVTCAAN